MKVMAQMGRREVLQMLGMATIGMWASPSLGGIVPSEMSKGTDWNEAWSQLNTAQLADHFIGLGFTPEDSDVIATSLLDAEVQRSLAESITQKSRGGKRKTLSVDMSVLHKRLSKATLPARTRQLLTADAHRRFRALQEGFQPAAAVTGMLSSMVDARGARDVSLVGIRSALDKSLLTTRLLSIGYEEADIRALMKRIDNPTSMLNGYEDIILSGGSGDEGSTFGFYAGLYLVFLGLVALAVTNNIGTVARTKEEAEENRRKAKESGKTILLVGVAVALVAWLVWLLWD